MSRCERPSGPCPWPRCACSTPCPTCPARWVSLDELDRDDDQAALEREAELDRDDVDDVDDPFDWPDVDGDERSCGFPACDCSCPCKLWVGTFGDPEIDALVRDDDDGAALSFELHVDLDEFEWVLDMLGMLGLLEEAGGSATPSGEASLPRDPAGSDPVGSASRGSA